MGKSKAKRGEEKKKDSTTRWLQENLEAIVVAVILALIIRHFTMEAFVIPTGSMAPTLLGDHFTLECPDCGADFHLSGSNINQASIGRDVRGRRVYEVTLHCPYCGHAMKDLEVPMSSKSTGNKILVNKFIYEISKPARWDVIVFKYPEDPTRNFIKRLIALPGERLSIRKGDVYIDGELQRKPKAVQEELFMPVFDLEYVGREAGIPWSCPQHSDAWRYDAEDEVVRAEVPDLAYYRYASAAAIDGDVYDSYAYNAGRSNADGGNHVADLRVSAAVRPDEGTTSVRLVLTENARRIEATVSVGGGDAVLTREGGEVGRAAGVSLAPGEEEELSLAYVDQRVTLTVGGEDRIVWDDDAPIEMTVSCGVEIGLDRGSAIFTDLRVQRDVYYMQSNGYHFDPAVGEVQVPADSYFVLGDNCPNSQDSRTWGFVRKGHLVGRAFLVFWPVIPWEIRLIR